MANSVDPDQTAPIGSMLFVSILNSSVMLGKYLQQTTFQMHFFLGALRVNCIRLYERVYPDTCRKCLTPFTPFMMHIVCFLICKCILVAYRANNMYRDLPTFLKSGARGLLNWGGGTFGPPNLGKLELDCHFKWIKNQQCKISSVKLLKVPTINTSEKLPKNVNENMFSFTFLCNFSCICNFGIFNRIFMKFSPKCKTLKLGMIYTILGKFLLIFKLGRTPDQVTLVL